MVEAVVVLASSTPAAPWLRFFRRRPFPYSSRQHLDCSKCAEIRLSQYYFCLDSELFEVDPDYRVGASSAGVGGFRLEELAPRDSQMQELC